MLLTGIYCIGKYRQHFQNGCKYNPIYNGLTSIQNKVNYRLKEHMFTSESASEALTVSITVLVNSVSITVSS